VGRGHDPIASDSVHRASGHTHTFALLPPLGSIQTAQQGIWLFGQQPSLPVLDNFTQGPEQTDSGHGRAARGDLTHDFLLLRLQGPGLER